jgi:hypothetical protein
MADKVIHITCEGCGTEGTVAIEPDGWIRITSDTFWPATPAANYAAKPWIICGKCERRYRLQP